MRSDVPLDYEFINECIDAANDEYRMELRKQLTQPFFIVNFVKRVANPYCLTDLWR